MDYRAKRYTYELIKSLAAVMLITFRLHYLIPRFMLSLIKSILWFDREDPCSLPKTDANPELENHNLKSEQSNYVKRKRTEREI